MELSDRFRKQVEPRIADQRRSDMIGTKQLRGRGPRSLAVAALAAAGLVGAAACTAQGGEPGGDGGWNGGPPGGTLRARLVAFHSCDQALDQLRQSAMRSVGPYGLPGSGMQMPLAEADV